MALSAILFVGCKPTESGYRQAYEKTIANSDEERLPGYTSMADELPMKKMIAGNDTIDSASAFVAITPGIGNPPAKLKPYCIVAGSFRQRFTASDMCQRLVDNGCDSAFVVQTGKPRYYVVAKSCSEPKQAAETLRKLQSDSVITAKAFILMPAKI